MKLKIKLDNEGTLRLSAKLLTIAFAVLSSVYSFGQSTYIKKYAGAYSIGRDTGEAYALKVDGTCTWIWGWMSNGKLQTQKKYGTWTATDGRIRISIDGYSGTIVEVYILKNGRFVNIEDSNRYLTKSN